MEKSEIKYLVLSSLGYSEKPDFVNSGDSAVQVVNNQYDHYLSLCISKNKWNFFTAQTELIQFENEGKYKYKYEVPVDMEILNSACSDDGYRHGLSDYQMYGGYIHTDSEKVFIDYQKKVCEDSLSPYFIEYFRLEFAFGICHLLTGDMQLEQLLAQKTQIAFAQAKALDNLQKPVKIIDSGVFSNVRNW